jgi:hypothetical protein
MQGAGADGAAVRFGLVDMLAPDCCLNGKPESPGIACGELRRIADDCLGANVPKQKLPVNARTSSGGRFVKKWIAALRRGSFIVPGVPTEEIDAPAAGLKFAAAPADKGCRGEYHAQISYAANAGLSGVFCLPCFGVCRC